MNHSVNQSNAAWHHMIQSMITPDVVVLDQASVDQKIWHTVKLTWPAADWIRTQDSTKWHELTGAAPAMATLFDIEESLLTVLMLKWK